VVHVAWTSRLHLPASLGSTGITRLRRYYGRSDSCAGGLGRPSANRPGWPRAGLPAYVENLLTLPSPTTPGPPDCRVWVFLALGLHRMLGRHPPLAVIPLPSSRASLGLRLSLAGSPRPQAESSSLTLRTSHSPPVAPHPASRRRSYLRLREAKPPLDGDLHPAYSQPSQAHECGGVRRFGFFFGFCFDRGREDRLSSIPPPSEPDRRISRIRLSR